VQKPGSETNEMKVLTATSQTQGWRDNDFCWTVEGELVLFVPFECSRGSIDDGCGCRRSMGGAVSHRATTTMQVTERSDLNADAYFGLIADSLESQGYVNERLLTKAEVEDWVRDLSEELISLAAPWPVGTVVERRGDFIMLRARPSDGDRRG
jgi:hypothetical protein